MSTMILGQSAMPQARPPDLLQQFYSEYPKAKSLNLDYRDESAKGVQNGRKLEAFPPEERDNPQPGRYTVIRRDPKTGTKDLLGETLHFLPKTDPKVGAVYQQFLSSMTPQQKQQLQAQYDRAKTEGETRPFEQWSQLSGNDAWFRGYISGQWPKEAYTPEQIKMFDDLHQYLKSK